MFPKNKLDELALLGGPPVFATVRSTSNLVRPDIEVFLGYIKRSFDRRWLTNNGPAVLELEKRLEDLHQVRHCIAVCNGFWGLVLAITQLALPGRKEVILPTMTYRRMADIVAWANLVPHYCDIDASTLGASVESVSACINDETALILVAHPIVNLCDIEGLTRLAEKRGIPILFDSVEAAYASYDGKMVGSFGDAECFSMHASKLLNGFEGGYITTNNTALADKLRKIRAFGFSGQDNIEMLGINAKLNDIHASMALASLDDLENQIHRNRERYQLYSDLLEAVPGISLVKYSNSEKRGFKNILAKLGPDWPLSRQSTLDILHAENMLARTYYNPPLHAKETSYPSIRRNYPVADSLTEQFLLLPTGEFVSPEDIKLITGLLHFIYIHGPEMSDRMVNA